MAHDLKIYGLFHNELFPVKFRTIHAYAARPLWEYCDRGYRRNIVALGELSAVFGRQIRDQKQNQQWRAKVPE